MDHDTKYRMDVNKENLERVIKFVDVMDGKARFILTLVLALTAYFVAQLGSYVDAHAKWGVLAVWVPPFFIVLDALAIGCLGCFIATAITVISAIAPRTEQHTGRKSPFFFGTIASLPLEDFKKTMNEITPNQVIDQLADQTYDNAKIVTRKTDHVRRSIKLFYCGMGCFFAFTIGRPVLLSLVGR